MKKKVSLLRESSLLQRELCNLTPPMELGGEWLIEAERRDRSFRNESLRSNQHKIYFEHANDFERLNADFNPT